MAYVSKFKYENYVLLHRTNFNFLGIVCINIAAESATYTMSADLAVPLSAGGVGL